jgi:hypothetical protein
MRFLLGKDALADDRGYIHVGISPEYLCAEHLDSIKIHFLPHSTFHTQCDTF